MVSILIPFKNTEEFLIDCIDSILNQTYKDWEVIAVNDHSTDKSLQIVTSYTLKNSKVKVYTNAGNGIIPALKLAYSKSSGEFITRMDSDDIMKPNRLQIMVDSLQKMGKGHVAVGQVKYFSNRGISDGYSRYEKWLNGLTAKGTNYSEIYKECVIPSPCWMVFREDFEECRAFNSERYPEDYDLTFRFYEKKLQIIPCNHILLLWRDYDSRTSRTHEHYAQNYFLDIKLHYFLRLDFDEKRPLVLWGGGFKGKEIAKSLIKKQVDFIWLCDNPNKINKNIYEQNLYHFSKLETLEKPQSIITVANENAQLEIKNYLKKLGNEPAKDYFFFC
ncbi:glycosyltransferase family 2 protein [uncultured Croceitalea sp.]|uniref:glycosyltransferase family 2 protein n=1 Tax=uncultured Croceitalea sp. TaxID=1798908 RepID=UPI00374FD1E0